MSNQASGAARVTTTQGRSVSAVSSATSPPVTMPADRTPRQGSQVAASTTTSAGTRYASGLQSRLSMPSADFAGAARAAISASVVPTVTREAKTCPSVLPRPARLHATNAPSSTNPASGADLPTACPTEPASSAYGAPPSSARVATALPQSTAVVHTGPYPART